MYRAFLTTLMDRPAEMFSTLAPSFWACLTLEFMKTVQRLPRSTDGRQTGPGGELLYIIAQRLAKVCRKLPQPEEQASFRRCR